MARSGLRVGLPDDVSKWLSRGAAVSEQKNISASVYI